MYVAGGSEDLPVFHVEMEMKMINGFFRKA
jgi:hypothetical protein